MALDHDSLWLKSKLLMDRALVARDEQRNDDFLLWSALLLEVLGKARLAKLHPALVADPQQADTLLAVCGGPPTSNVRSIGASTVFKRCHKTVPGFDASAEEFCIKLADDRNAHLHSGAVPFAAQRPDVWQSKFWTVVSTLVAAQGRTLEELVGNDEAAAIRSVVSDALKNRSVSAQRRVARHREMFKQLPFDERSLRAAGSKLLEQQLEQDVDSERKGHPCPACGHVGTLTGEVVGEAVNEHNYDDGVTWYDCSVAAESFRCATCGLKLDGIDELEAAGLPDEYKKTIVREMEGEPYGND